MAVLSQEEVKFWLNEVDSSLKRREKDFIKKNHYPLLLKYYEGDMSGEKGDEFGKRRHKQRLAVMNEYFPNTNAIIAEIMYQNPDITAEPTKPQAEEGAPAMKGALQYAFNRVDAITENKLALFDMLYAGFSAVEVNHINMNEEENREAGERQGITSKVRSMLRKKPDNDEQAEEELAKVQPAKEEGYATIDETYVRRWSPLDVILDYRAERLKDLRYIGKIIRMTHAEFSARYPDYKDKVTADDSVPFSQHKEEAQKKMVTLYELQVKKAGGKYVNIVISPSFKAHEIDFWERPYTTNGFNMKIGQLHEYGKLYPVSVAQINKGMQDDINNYVTFKMETAERNIPKRGINKDKVTEDSIAKLNSRYVNDIVPVKGGPESIWTIPNTNISNDNNEMLALMFQKKEELWNVSKSRIQGNSGAKFATELRIQEAGFQARQADIQEGLRKLIRAELDCLKDIIAQFWDKPFFFKITGMEKPAWYEPITDPQTGIVINPLAEMLTGDYMIDVDISSALRPNKEQKKKELIEYLSWLASEPIQGLLMAQGKTLNIDLIKQTADKFDLNAETILIDFQPPEPPPPEPQEIGDVTTKEVEEVADETGNKQVRETKIREKKFA